MDHPTELPTLTGSDLSLRPAGEADVPALVQLLADPEVQRWWGPHDAGAVRADLNAVPCWAIVVDSRVAGWLQVNEERTEAFPSVAFDIALDAGARGRGLGQAALRLAIEHFAQAGHHRFTIDPAVENERAIRCYRALGFKPVGVLRQYQRAPGGVWRDGLLMDLLADELTPGPGARTRPGSSSF